MSDSEMKLEFVQPGIPSHAAGFGRTENLNSYDIDLKKDKTAGKEYCPYLSPSVDCIGENSKSLLEKVQGVNISWPLLIVCIFLLKHFNRRLSEFFLMQTNAEMVEATESWNSHPAIKVLICNFERWYFLWD